MHKNTIYQELKNQIIQLEYEPGSVIREKEIMEKFGVSRTPAREALMRLEMDGFVRIIPNVGSFVEEVSFRQLKSVLEVRSHLIKLSGKLAAERITDSELNEIEENIKMMQVKEDKKELMRLDGEIHKIINNSTKNEVLAKMLNGLHNQVVRFWTFSGAEGTFWDELINELQEITLALGNRDQDAAAQLLENHTKQFVENMRSQLTF